MATLSCHSIVLIIVLIIALLALIQAATKIRTHFLSLLEPLRTSITTNIQVLQGSIFIKKYLPLYRFLQRRASSTADEFRVAYVRCAKLYYETGIRRYTRSLGYVRVRHKESPEPKLRNAEMCIAYRRGSMRRPRQLDRCRLGVLNRRSG